MAKNKRDDFTKTTIRSLQIRVGGYCSRPECRKMTIIPSAGDPSSFETTGRAAHITAASEKGPRYDASLTPAERKSASNGIWLCADCADLIDKNGGDDYSCELIRSWKARAEQEVSNASLLNTTAAKPAWLDKLSSPHYVNVPRILNLSPVGALSPEVLHTLKSGFPERGLIVRPLLEVSNSLRQLSIKAVDVEQLLKPEDQVGAGLVISFFRRCRTKNGSNTDALFVEDYSFDKSPLIYTDANSYRYVFPYDPVWLTTSTARASMRQGTVQLAGLGIVKNVDHVNKTVISTPLTFGIPDLFGMFN